MGAAGIVPLDNSYVQRLHKMIKNMGGLFVADEVQTGFGRVGK
jgi:4-aminobutyrate aminotransferase-like enzyme